MEEAKRHVDRCPLPDGALSALPQRERGSPSRFQSFTERNDQTEQEERREIKQRLTRKVLGLSTLSAECDGECGRKGAGPVQAQRAATRASPRGPECGFPAQQAHQQALETPCLSVWGPVGARSHCRPHRGRLRAGPSDGLPLASGRQAWAGVFLTGGALYTMPRNAHLMSGFGLPFRRSGNLEFM